MHIRFVLESKLEVSSEENEAKMQIEKLTCSSCGASQLEQVGPSRFQCPYCQTSYLIDFDPSTGELQDAQVKGDMQSAQVFAVHGKITVRGDANKIVLKKNAAEARHVGNLEIVGDANTITAVLLDGATYDLIGDANKIKNDDAQGEGGFWSKVRNLL